MDKLDIFIIVGLLLIGWILGVLSLGFLSNLDDKTWVAVCHQDNKTHLVTENIYIGNGAYMDKIYNEGNYDCDRLSIHNEWKITWGYL